MIARIGNIIGYFLIILGLCELLPLVVAFFSGEKNLILPFFISSLFTVFVGGALFLSFQVTQERIMRHEIIVLMVSIWLILPFFASFPFMITGFMTKLTDAFFEATSALTTSGASLVINLDVLPTAILFWRALLQWIGGILVFVMAISILPLTAIGGMDLFRSVLPHGEGDDMLARMRYAFAPLFKIYTGMTMACGFLLFLSGMDGFTALLTAMAALSSGGFVSQGASNVNSLTGWAELILIPFMIFAATNMTYHWAMFKRGRASIYRQDPEIFNFLYTLLLASIIIFLILMMSGNMQGTSLFGKAGIAIFTAVSTMTTTGFLPDHASSLPLSVIIISLILLFIGGTAGSTAGGFKILRITLMKRHADKEVSQLVYPNGVMPITFSDLVVAQSTLISVWTLLFLFVTAIAVSTILFGVMGYGLQTSFGLSATNLFSAGNLITMVSPDFVGYYSLPYVGKWLASMVMILGRLEVIALLIFLMPSFWRN